MWQPTLPDQKVPVVLHEPAILGGYRVPHQPWSYYFLSIFQIHNETVNIWTHLIGCFVLVFKLYGYMQEFDINTDNILSTLILFTISYIIGFLTSAMVHLLHSKSSYVHFVAFMIDYLAASFCGFGSGIISFYGCSEVNTYRYLEFVYLPVLTFTSFFNYIILLTAKVWYGHDPHNMNRKYMFIAGMGMQGLVNSVPFVPRYYICFQNSTCSITSLNYLTVITIIFILAAIAFASHQPEKTWPGKFDIFGHGHQWFHLLVVINDVIQMDATYADHVTGSNSHVDPNLRLILGVMAAMFVLDFIILYAVLPFIPACLERVKHAEHEN